ncbi:putative peptidase S10, serine carboxypeptidase, alpha/Beta hydrolase [Plasmopara halstedii]
MIEQHVIVSVLMGVFASAKRMYPVIQQDDKLETEEENEEIEESVTDTMSANPNEKATEDLVHNLPGLDPSNNVTQHAGFISLYDDDTNRIFYWHIQTDQNADKAPLVIWLNGGPGCSSMQGLFLGISPFKVMKNLTIGTNEHSWHKFANLLFVDQPVGTGMSYTKGNVYRSTEEAVAKDFYEFLIKFLQRHSTYLSDGDDQVKHSTAIYFFGESHAGRWIPEISEYILQRNAGHENHIKINVDGIGIGNGWVHPKIQYEYSDYAHGIGLLTFGQVRSLKASYTECLTALDSGTYYSKSCFKNMDDILSNVQVGKGAKKLNFYDVRQYVNNVNDYPFGMDTIVKYMNKADVRKALHGNEDNNYRFNMCSSEVHKALLAFDGVSTLDKLSSLLQKGVRVLFYNGQWDMMCNHYGTEKLLLNLEWNGSEAYQQAPKYTWRVQGHHIPAGFAQQGGNLTYLVVAGAGHAVPMDVPDVAADMLYRFVNKLAFTDIVQAIANTRLNSTDPEFSYCNLPITTSATNTSFNQNNEESSEAHISTTWLWVLLGISAASIILAVCVTIVCLRRRRHRRLDHEKVTQVSDEENVEQLKLGELEDEPSDGESNGEIILEEGGSQRASNLEISKFHH